jgi:hypothetical protein
VYNVLNTFKVIKKKLFFSRNRYNEDAQVSMTNNFLFFVAVLTAKYAGVSVLAKFVQYH